MRNLLAGSKGGAAAFRGKAKSGEASPRLASKTGTRTWGTRHRELLLRLQLGVFGLGLFEDGDVGVGVFPQRKEVFVCPFCFCGVA